MGFGRLLGVRATPLVIVAQIIDRAAFAVPAGVLPPAGNASFVGGGPAVAFWLARG